MKKNKTKKYIKRNIIIAWAILIILLIAALAIEFAIHKHAYFVIDGSRFFHAYYGFIACFFIIIVSKFLGIFLKKPENYYSNEEDV